MMFATAGAVAPYFTAGKLKPLAVASNQCRRFFPDVPILKKLNYPSVVQEELFGLLAAAGTPLDVVKKLNEHLNKALAYRAVRGGLEHLFVEVGAPAGPEKFRSFVAKEATPWGKVIADSGTKAGQSLSMRTASAPAKHACPLVCPIGSNGPHRGRT